MNDQGNYLWGIVGKQNFQVLFEDKLSVAIIWGNEHYIASFFLSRSEVVHFKNKLVRQEKSNF